MLNWPRRTLLAALPAGLAIRPMAAQAASLRRGVNTWPWFSLTREYPAPRTDYAWPPYEAERPVPRPADLGHLRAAGFDFIRIPVDPGPFLSFEGAQRAALLQALFTAVGDAMAAGLSVLVNIQANAATHFWTPDRMFGSREAPAFAAYTALVQTVAQSLGRLDPARVALEPINEPPQSCNSATWTEVQITLMRAARRVAPGLSLVATGSCGSMVSGLVQLDPAPLLTMAPMLFTFHFYEPYLFSHQGAPWMREPVYRDLNAVPWPAAAGTLERTLTAVRARMAQDHGLPGDAQREAYRETERVLGEYFAAQPDRPFLQNYVDQVSLWSERHGIPASHILMGEFGALGSDARYVAAGKADRERYIRDVRQVAETSGFGWAVWNLMDGMGIMDDSTRALDPGIIAALGLKLPTD